MLFLSSRCPCLQLELAHEDEKKRKGGLFSWITTSLCPGKPQSTPNQVPRSHPAPACLGTRNISACLGWRRIRPVLLLRSGAGTWWAHNISSSRARAHTPDPRMTARLVRRPDDYHGGAGGKASAVQTLHRQSERGAQRSRDRLSSQGHAMSPDSSRRASP